jgi:hypothetical protein
MKLDWHFQSEIARLLSLVTSRTVAPGIGPAGTAKHRKTPVILQAFRSLAVCRDVSIYLKALLAVTPVTLTLF